MSKRSLKIGVIGCGMISSWYFRAAKRFHQMNIVACGDLNAAMAEAQGKEFGIPVKSVDAIFADPEIDLILNLTPPKVHTSIARRALESGKHTYSEKPLGIDLDEGKALLKLAAEKHLTIGCAPDTFLGGWHQTMRKLLDEGAIGRPFAGTVFNLWRGPEKWPRPAAFFDVGGGPMLDMGPYFMVQLINLLGPAVAVTACVTNGELRRTGGPDSVPHEYPVNVPTHQTGIIEFANGTQITAIISYEAYGTCRHPFVELYGTKGSLSMQHPNDFAGHVELIQENDADWRPIPAQFIYTEDARSIGVADMVEAILDHRPPRASGEMALHALDLMLAFERSAKARKRVELTTTCARPAPMNPVTVDGTL